ncbi:MAG: AraC family transcriptional regulator [Archangium sp.]|nr:AraC family transcriptional regulator [Archangium sp.]
MPGRPTALGALVLPALEYGEKLGLARADLLEAAGLSEAFDPEVRVPSAVLLSLWAEGAKRSTDAFFGLHAGEHHVAARSVQIVGFAARQARTLGDAYAVTSEFGKVTNEASHIVFTREPKGVGRLEIGALKGMPEWPRAYNEMALAGYVCTGRRWTGQNVRPLAVEFQHAAVANVSEYERLFGVTPRFGAPINSLTFDAVTLDQPLDASDPALGEFLKQQARKQLTVDPSAQLVDRVREAVQAELAKGARASAIAKRVAMSERTLQRRLSEAGHGLKALIDDVRHQHAVKALARPSASVSEVARECGFSDAASFREAFRRWTGEVPREVKKLARQRA